MDVLSLGDTAVCYNVHAAACSYFFGVDRKMDKMDGSLFEVVGHDSSYR